MTVLVTGGAGYVGAHAMRELRRAGIACVALDNLVRGHRESIPPDDLIVGDVGDPSLVSRVLADRQISAVMHFAAYAYVGESVVHPAMYYANNVGSTINLLRCMVDTDVRTIVFSSTCSTYGRPESISIREDHPQQPVNPYGASKRSGLNFRSGQRPPNAFSSSGRTGQVLFDSLSGCGNVRPYLVASGCGNRDALSRQNDLPPVLRRFGPPRPLHQARRESVSPPR